MDHARATPYVAFIHFGGGQLKLLINNDPNGKGEAPAEFSTRRGDGLRFLILKPASPQADDEK